MVVGLIPEPSAVIGVILIAAMISALYALIAIGFTMIFGVGGVLNLAHGALIMAGAYTYVLLSGVSPLNSIDVPFVGVTIVEPPLPAVAAGIAAVVVVTVLSVLLYLGLVRYIEDNPVITFLATVVVAVLFTELLINQIGTQVFSYGFLEGSLQLEGIGVRFLWDQVLAFVASWIAIGLLWYYVTQTDSGRAIRATSMSERGAQLTGVDIGKVRTRTWLIAGALAGLAGLFLGTLQATSPQMWLTPLALAFIIVVIGGIGSIKGSVVAAYLIGFLETGSVAVFGEGARGILALLVLVFVLLVMPQGLFGREYVHE